jgi:hypothetical protein
MGTTAPFPMPPVLIVSVASCKLWDPRCSGVWSELGQSSDVAGLVEVDKYVAHDVGVSTDLKQFQQSIIHQDHHNNKIGRRKRQRKRRYQRERGRE